MASIPLTPMGGRSCQAELSTQDSVVSPLEAIASTSAPPPTLVRTGEVQSDGTSKKSDIGFWTGLAQSILKPLGLWVRTRGLNTSEGVPNGFARVTAFIAADPDNLTSIYKRFDALSIRNLLFLEARVAALEELQRKLDKEDADMLRGVFHRSDNENFALQTTGQSFEYFACLVHPTGTLNQLDDRRIPKFAFEEWRTGREKEKKQWKVSHNNDENTIIEPPENYFRQRWELAMAIQEALKEYRKRILDWFIVPS